VTLRQVGKSVLGVGAGQGVTGGYTVIGGDARIELGHFGLSLTVENLGNARSNTFSFGNPFGLSQGTRSPLRPRTVRLGVDARF
jgi:outer membrane receptor protein involved in Fe transport